MLKWWFSGEMIRLRVRGISTRMIEVKSYSRNVDITLGV